MRREPTTRARRGKVSQGGERACRGEYRACRDEDNRARREGTRVGREMRKRVRAERAAVCDKGSHPSRGSSRRQREGTALIAGKETLVAKQKSGLMREEDRVLRRGKESRAGRRESLTT